MVFVPTLTTSQLSHCQETFVGILLATSVITSAVCSPRLNSEVSPVVIIFAKEFPAKADTKMKNQ